MFFLKRREDLTQGFEIILKIDKSNAFSAIFKEIVKIFSKIAQTIVLFVQSAKIQAMLF